MLKPGVGFCPPWLYWGYKNVSLDTIIPCPEQAHTGRPISATARARQGRQRSGRTLGEESDSLKAPAWCTLGRCGYPSCHNDYSFGPWGDTLSSIVCPDDVSPKGGKPINQGRGGLAVARAPHGVGFSLVDQTRGGTTREPLSQGALAWAIPKGVRDAERLSPISLRASFALSQVVPISSRY